MINLRLPRDFLMRKCDAFRGSFCVCYTVLTLSSTESVNGADDMVLFAKVPFLLPCFIAFPSFVANSSFVVFYFVSRLAIWSQYDAIFSQEKHD